MDKTSLKIKMYLNPVIHRVALVISGFNRITNFGVVAMPNTNFRARHFLSFLNNKLNKSSIYLDFQ